MSAAHAPLAFAERARVLALLGVDRWVLRGAAPDCGSDPGRDRVAEASRPGPLPQVSAVPVARLAIVTGEGDPLAGRYAPLLRHVLRTLAVEASAVVWSAEAAMPLLAFGASPGDAADAVLAPPLATLRASGAARRALWPALRALRRRLREVR